MIQLKCFQSRNAEVIEQQVNQWIDQQNAVNGFRIDHTESSQAGDMFVSIWYEVEADSRYEDPNADVPIL